MPKEHPTLTQLLQAAVKNDDWEAVRRISQILAGASRMLAEMSGKSDGIL